MTAKELQKRNNKAEKLRVLQTSNGQLFVESEKGQILYNVIFTDDETSCGCGDYIKNSRRDPQARCKHILAVMNCIPTGDVEAAQFLVKKKPQLDPRFIIQIDGQDFVKFQGLLDLGHQKGISSITVEPIQIPSPDNDHFAVCKATVIGRVGETFTDIGDASNHNTNARVSKHITRIASTRAIARALRAYTNIGLTCLEELADLKDVVGNKDKKPAPKAKRKPTKKTTATGTKIKDKEKTVGSDKPEATGDNVEDDRDFNRRSENVTKPKMSEAQRKAIANLSRRRGISVEELEQMSVDAYGCALENLNSKDASAFIRNLQQAA